MAECGCEHTEIKSLFFLGPRFTSEARGQPSSIVSPEGLCYTSAHDNSALPSMTTAKALLRGEFWTALQRLLAKDFWWAEFFSALGLVIWALVNMASPRALSQDNFGVLLHIAPERFWEEVALALGGLQIAALASDISWARAIAAGLCGYLLSIIVLNMLGLGHWPPGGIGFYIAALLTQSMALWKNILAAPAKAPAQFPGQ